MLLFTISLFRMRLHRAACRITHFLSPPIRQQSKSQEKVLLLQQSSFFENTALFRTKDEVIGTPFIY